MADFLTAVTKTLEYEGGLVDNPDDPGGLTNFGIALNEHPELTAEDIRAMTRTRAIGIYRQKYWFDLYDQIEDQAIASSLFDFGVRSGIQTAVKILQQVLVGDWVRVDGISGEHTLLAVNQRPPRGLRVNFTAARLKFYVALNKPQFLHSWFARTIDILLG
jgi:type VI secretion system secreted protein VgrG